MPFDSNGNFTRTQNWTSDYENGIEIVCDRHDDEDDNFANGFNQTFCRDGRTVATGNFKMGNFKITGMADGQTSNDAVTKGQLDAINSALNKSISDLSDSLTSAKANISLDNIDESGINVIKAMIDEKLKPILERSYIPNYRSYTDISSNTYNVTEDGWIYWRAYTAGGNCKVNGLDVATSGSYYDQIDAMFLVGKGDVVTCTTKNTFRFIPFRTNEV